jgi:quercetin dioxygenase-like cupin family protein
MTLPAFPEFEARARADGFEQVLVRDWDPDTVVGTHTHPFAARALVVRGEMWLTCAGETRRLVAGDTFELEHSVPHEERYGAEGATYWVARR